MIKEEALALLVKLEWAGDTPGYYSGYCKLCGAGETSGEHYNGCQFKELVEFVEKCSSGEGN
jgi:hypothetical protein